MRVKSFAGGALVVGVGLVGAVVAATLVVAVMWAILVFGEAIGLGTIGWDSLGDRFASMSPIALWLGVVLQAGILSALVLWRIRRHVRGSGHESLGYRLVDSATAGLVGASSVWLLSIPIAIGLTAFTKLQDTWMTDVAEVTSASLVGVLLVVFAINVWRSPSRIRPLGRPVDDTEPKNEAADASRAGGPVTGPMRIRWRTAAVTVLGATVLWFASGLAQSSIAPPISFEPTDPAWPTATLEAQRSLFTSRNLPIGVGIRPYRFDLWANNLGSMSIDYAEPRRQLVWNRPWLEADAARQEPWQEGLRNKDAALARLSTEVATIDHSRRLLLIDARESIWGLTLSRGGADLRARSFLSTDLRYWWRAIPHEWFRESAVELPPSRIANRQAYAWVAATLCHEADLADPACIAARDRRSASCRRPQRGGGRVGLAGSVR